MAASPMANDIYNRFLEKFGNVFCRNGGEERHREIEVELEQRLKVETEELALTRERELQMQEMLKQTKAEKDVLEKTLQDANKHIEVLKEENKVLLSEAEDNAREQEATQEELAAEIQLRNQEEERRKQAEEREALVNNDAKEKSQMLEDVIAERDACIAARARKGLFRRRGGKDSTSRSERKAASIQSALVEIWTTSDWLFALF